MNEVIYKYNLNLTLRNQAVLMPNNASLLKVALQGNGLCLWVRCNLKQE